ncbi:MAG TPA: helix-turn-helix transcriptional regulator [Blastocatellia bacterium]|jgi:DNA-binding XRE family transcriptional regulator|nr:helix-turn-helix transcriptional regulator [Blastocatellia bacterium]
MSSNTSEAATTAIDQEGQDNQTSPAGQQSQENSTATANQDSQVSTPSPQGQEARQQTATTRQEGDNDPAASTGGAAQGSQPAAGWQGQGGQAAASGQGIQNSADITGGTDPHADDTAKMASEPKPDVSDQDFQELLPKLLNYFHNNREELARAVGLHRSTVDRWLNGKSRPNNSTVLRMRRLAQERRIE